MCPLRWSSGPPPSPVRPRSSSRRPTGALQGVRRGARSRVGHGVRTGPEAGPGLSFGHPGLARRVRRRRDADVRAVAPRCRGARPAALAHARALARAAARRGDRGVRVYVREASRQGGHGRRDGCSRRDRGCPRPHRVFTYVRDDNVPSLRGCAKVGFRPRRSWQRRSGLAFAGWRSNLSTPRPGRSGDAAVAPRVRPLRRAVGPAAAGRISTGRPQTM